MGRDVAPKLGPGALTPAPNEQILLDNQLAADPTPGSPESIEEGTRFQRLLAATRHASHVAMRGGQTALVLLELTPANEAVRLAAWSASENVIHNPAAAGAFSLGLSTFAVEAVGAIAGASLLDTGPSKRVANFLNKKLSKTSRNSGQAEFSLATKAGAAYAGGSVAAMALEKIEQPNSTVEQSRHFGLWTSTWLAGALAVEGALASEIGNVVGFSQAETVGTIAGALAAGAAGNWLRKRIARSSLNRKQEAYLNELDTTTSPQRSGLGNEELANASKDKGTINAQVEYGEKSYSLPVLVPTTSLYWYNQELLKGLFPDTDTYFFTQVRPRDTVVNAAMTALEQHKVILTADSTAAQELTERVQLLTKSGDHLIHNSLEGAYLNQYIGSVDFTPDQKFQKAPDFVTQYREAVADGTITEDLQNGTAIVDKITGEDADRLWAIYERPFDSISTSSPIHAGFDKEGFYAALEDPTVAKVINRQDGVITTLALFGTDIKTASWLNEDYFTQTYPEACETDNILLFLGIVSDENIKGRAYSLALIDLLMRVGQLRNTKTLLTFECNEVSAAYLPLLVKRAIKASGLAKVSGLETPVAQTTFSTLQLVSGGES